MEPELTQQHYLRGLTNLAEISNNTPLSQTHLQLALTLVDGLARHSQLGFGLVAGAKLPDKDARMYPVEHLYYMEPDCADWLSEDGLPEAMRCIHKDIDPALAAKLNVQSLRQIHEVNWLP